MNYLLAFLVLMLTLAVLRILLMVVGVALLLALLVAIILRPRDTLVSIGSLGLLGLASAQPIACLITLGIVGDSVVVVGAKRESRSVLLLTDRRGEH